MNLLSYQSFYLIGIKGVAMTALAQCLIDACKQVRGSDVGEEFVTQEILNKLQLKIDIGFEHEIPTECDCVIYTAAHNAQANPQVIQAKKKELTTLPHAVALAELFNAKKGIAVCGVGGKSTTSAMISWIMEKESQERPNREVSFAVGVGNIPGLDKTGQWSANSEYFVAEADEYVIDPAAVSRGEEITPRFSFLKPVITVCTNLQFDHPDVYRDFDHTKEVYASFFAGIKEGGVLIINSDNLDLVELAMSTVLSAAQFGSQNRQITSFGNGIKADLQLIGYESQPGFTLSVLIDKLLDEKFTLRLQVPGEFNVMNAMAAILATAAAGVEVTDAIRYLADFRSTLRRAQYIGEKRGIQFYDDYAHHPDEIKKVIQAFREWFPDQRIVVAFQSHTFSRTKALFNEFVEAFTEADEVAMIDIFASARELADDSVSSDLLCTEIEKKHPGFKAENFKTLPELAEYLQEKLKSGDVCITVGAGDIYHLHDLL